MKTNLKKKDMNPLPPVAIIGMGCLFPKSPNLKAYWRLLFQGSDAIGEIPATHWSPDEFFDPDLKKTDHVCCKRGGFLSPVSFDPSEFGIPPNIMEAIDTSQLLGLVAVRMALEDAGYGTARPLDRERVSVILGVTGTQELVIPLSSRLGRPKWRRALEAAGLPAETCDRIIERIAAEYVPWQENSFPGLLGNVVAGRIANRFDLGGTNCVVDAACASSLSAVHMGLLELAAGRSDMVLTGGVDALNDIFMHMCFAKTQVLSPSGDARPFSSQADGTVLGEGIGILALKRLADARQDRDKIYAVIKSMGSSSDGKSQSIYSPAAKGQIKALQRAYREARVDPGTVELIEAHGTGTRVGDQVEFQALKQFFKGSGNGTRHALGSVKSMIGHTKAAAGAAGLIKAALALHNKVLPPTLKAQTPDPQLDIEGTEFYLNSTTRPWFQRAEHPRRSGVSAFGFGGSNFHVVLEEYQPTKNEIAWDGSVEILAFSANDPQQLVQRVQEFKSDRDGHSASQFLAARAAQSRANFSSRHPYRLLYCTEIPENSTDAAEAIARRLSTGLEKQGTRSAWHQDDIYFNCGQADAKLAFVFPGQGSQYAGMGRDLICTFPSAFNILEAAGAQLPAGTRLGDLIYPPAVHTPEQKQKQEAALRATDIAQPALCALSAAMLQVLSDFGIAPQAACGHSLGELAALYAAGHLDRRNLLDLAVVRGGLMARAGQDNPQGAGSMLAVNAPLDELASKIATCHDDVVLANRNSPCQGVLAGSAASIARIQEKCSQWGYRTVLLPVAAAFHSQLVQAAQKPFAEAVRKIEFNTARLPVFSNTTGEPYPRDIQAAKQLLGNQLALPVDFIGNIENLFAMGVKTFVEVGPRSVLTGLIKQILSTQAISAVALDASGGKQSGILDLARTLCLVAVQGHPVDLTRWENPARNRPVARMNIPICGANTPRKRSAPASTDRSDHHPKPLTARVVGPTPVSRTRAPAVEAVPHLESEPMSERSINDQPAIAQALKTVQAGMQSMQALQRQTAETHQRFLENQTQASLTLQEMVGNAQRLVESALGRPMSSPLPLAPPAPVQPELETATSAPKGRPTLPAAESQFAAPTAADATARLAAEPPPDGNALPDIGALSPPTGLRSPKSHPAQTQLTAVVSQLTGYPPEMLTPEMDIEADLGIDSIKRVEIFSALEERLPGLPRVAPEIMATLKTLGQIGAFIADKQPTPAPRGHSQSQPAPGVADDDTTDTDLGAVLVEIIAALTGYPSEMLAPEMDIEADLGIDSIKRVEIFSALEERLPGLPRIAPETMATLKTLGQIGTFLTNNPPPLTDSPPVSSPPEPFELQPDPGASEHAAADTDLGAVLVEIIAALTGYPSEMLTPEMDIEADLGIDSIKRVEIFSALEERLPGLPRIAPETMATLKTLGQIAAFLSPTAPEGKPDRLNPTDRCPNPPGGQRQNTVARHVLSVAELLPGAEDDALVIPAGRKVFISADHTELGNALVDALATRQIAAQVLARDQIEAVLDDRLRLVDAGGLIVLLAPSSVPGESPAGAAAALSGDRQRLQTSLLLAGRLAPDLLASARQGGAIFATVTHLDGAFGLGAGRLSDPLLGAAAALAKTASLEWEGVRCRALDLADDWPDHRQMAQAVLSELLLAPGDGPVEIGLGHGRRCQPKMMPAPHPGGKIDLQPGEVVIITGGARGVTAHVALALAERVKPTVILVGRSARVTALPDWLTTLKDPAAMKKAILENEFGGHPPSPRQLEKVYQRYRAERQISRQLAKLVQLGVRTDYYAVDVRDSSAVKAMVSEIRSAYGPIRGLIHAAGVHDDHLIVDKTAEQFQAVFDTKVLGLQALLDATKSEPLKYIVLFSSVAARTGNRGQSDYAMANEALNKIAQHQTDQRPDCRVVSINWGPWEGGYGHCGPQTRIHSPGGRSDSRCGRGSSPAR